MFEQAANMITERSKLLVQQLIISKGCDKPPFLPFEMAKFLKIKDIFKTNLGTLGGMLLRFNDGYVIRINENDTVVRQNFSCAHEIGHILLSELKLDTYIGDIEFRSFNPQTINKNRIQAKERLCNIAASELLMPEAVFNNYLVDSNLSIFSLERLSNIFNSSIQTTAIRMAELSQKTCITINWKKQQKADQNYLKLNWQAGPGRDFSKRVRYFIVNDIASPDSLIFEAFRENKVTKCFKEFKTNMGNKRIQFESKGYGYGASRYVMSIGSLE